nr:LuxR C-terminal-related transcriptional regulator [Govania unica]
MQNDLILTKLTPPLGGRAMQPRRRLNELIRREGLRKLTLVAAPAGFGKTTLMAQWYHAMAEVGVTPCWVSLAADDRELRSFLGYVIGALRGIDPSIGSDAAELLESQGNIQPQKVIGRLVNDLVSEGRTVALFLDDYHTVDGPEVGAVVATLLALAPANFHLVIASRSTPGLPVATLRVRGELRELGLADLRFDDAETERFLRAELGGRLDGQQVATLQERTEGWAAGLQLATLALRDAGSWETFISSFSGSLREVADYLAADVLNRQRADVRDFLLKTGVLDRLNASLCDAVTGRTDSHHLLQEIEADGLFILPLDREQKWYRYHHLFSDFLRQHLDRSHPGMAADLYGRAGRWFAAANLPLEAVTYVMKAGDYDSVAALVEEHAHGMLKVGAMARVEDWIGRLPLSVIERRPRLPLFRCWALFHMRDPDRAVTELRRAERMIAERQARGESIGNLTPTQIAAEIDALRAGIAIACDDVEAVLDLSIEPTDCAPKDRTWIGAVTANIRGFALSACGRFAEAREILARAREMHREDDAPFGVVYADCFLGLVELAQGHLHAAAARFQQAADIADRSNCLAPGVALANVLRGTVLYEWNRIADAEGLIAPYLSILDECGHVEPQVMGYLTMARIKDSQGRHGEARTYHDRVREICGRKYFGRQRAQALHDELRALLLRGDLEAARERLREEQIPLESKPESQPGSWLRVTALHDVIRARFRIFDGQGAAALLLLRPVLAAAREAGRLQRVIELLLLTAEALRQSGEIAQARALVREAVLLGESERYVRHFLDEGPYVRDLLRMLDRDPEVPAHYLRQLLAGFEPPARADVAAGQPPRDLLSSRESNVLGLMAAGKSNRTIAQELAITENTVKWHIKNIFQKLGVENRTSAVLAAQQMKPVMQA